MRILFCMSWFVTRFSSFRLRNVLLSFCLVAGLFLIVLTRPATPAGATEYAWGLPSTALCHAGQGNNIRAWKFAVLNNVRLTKICLNLGISDPTTCVQMWDASDMTEPLVDLPLSVDSPLEWYCADVTPSIALSAGKSYWVGSITSPSGTHIHVYCDLGTEWPSNINHRFLYAGEQAHGVVQPISCAAPPEFYFDSPDRIYGVMDFGYEPDPSLVELSSWTVTVKSQMSIALNWETVSEIDTIGFNLWRAASEESPYEKINDAPIPSDGGPTLGSSYEYIDEGCPSQDCCYKLEDIDSAGVTTSHDPVCAEPSLPTFCGTATAGKGMNHTVWFLIPITVILGLSRRVRMKRA